MLAKVVFLRGGVSYSASRMDITGGAGIAYTAKGGMGYRVDYAITRNPYAGLLHTIQAVLLFGE